MIIKSSRNNIIVGQEPENVRPIGKFRFLMYDHSFDRPKLVLDELFYNKVTQVGLNEFSKLVNQESASVVPNYCVIGTGSNTPDISDTLLQAEIARTTMLVGSNARVNSQNVMQFYFGPTVGNGNIKEVGVVFNGTATANTGVLFDRALLDIVKTSLNSIYIYFTLTLTGS